MTLLFNILWAIFGGGIVIWLEYVFGGLLLCLTVVGIPFGLQCFKIAKLGLFPFGKDVEEIKQGLGVSTIGTVLNIIWIVFAGIWIFISHVTLGVSLALTLIGIPFALQHLKLAMLALAPFGRRSTSA
ncbi:MAG: YccF domain-containing protein [Deltaproteobacteria bacterium]|nr:YccF domain-containing protein [Deltaproteobacteria bacterium]